MWANLIVDGWQLPGMHVTARCVVSQFLNFLMQILANRLNISKVLLQSSNDACFENGKNGNVVALQTYLL